jgi:Putative addiction module component
MTIPKTNLEREIGNLSPPEQARIAADIIARLHGAQPDAVMDWAHEALVRYAEVKAGTAKTYEAADVLGEARRRVRVRRGK